MKPDTIVPGARREKRLPSTVEALRERAHKNLEQGAVTDGYEADRRGGPAAAG